jgi:serine/threonine protein kinase
VRSGNSRVIVKRVEQEEESIHRFLADIKDAKNHTMPLLEVICTSRDTFLIMPVAIRISIVGSVTFTHEHAFQLLDGVGFMHQNYVAHLDLKPDNLLLSSDGVRLFIIDFGLACRLADYKEELEGFRGTQPWVAPEVGEEDKAVQRFNPFAADLWATGRIIGYFSDHLEKFENRWLLDLVPQLMNEDPTKRLRLLKPISSNFRGTKRVSDDCLSMNMSKRPYVAVH